MLAIPALALVLFSKYKYPHPEMFEKESKEDIKFEFKKSSVFYMIAIGLFAFAALFFGWLFDKVGLKSLMISTLISSTFAGLVFLSDNPVMIIAGIVVWGIGMGALYDINIPAMVVISVLVQLIAVVFYRISIRTGQKSRNL